VELTRDELPLRLYGIFPPPRGDQAGFSCGSATCLLLWRGAATSAPNSPTFSERAGRMARQFIYHMQGLTKTYPGNRKVLENINLSFYPDAKIGVLGVNGSGKSTLLRIMAGIDTDFVGEGWVAEGARVG
jgi:ABC-type multidrug transport system fused ATPase/permease subunit